MIIICQDRETIVNFNNVSHLWINELTDCSELRARVSTCYDILLGEYESFHRACSILKDIQKRYYNSEYYKAIKNVLHSDNAFVYEMPFV